jgi:alanine racemase
VGVVRRLAGPEARIAAVVKADGYGHGLEVAARAFLAGGASLLCVATLDEAIVLRAAGVEAAILVLYSIPPEAAPAAALSHVELVAAEAGSLAATLAAWRAWPGAMMSEATLRLHLEIETGLARAGFRPSAAGDAAAAIAATPGAELAGLWSHLASSHDPDAAARQMERFGAAEAAIQAAGLRLPARHVAATGALMAGTGPSLEMVRPGLALYGEVPDGFPVAAGRAATVAELRSAMTLKARAIRLEWLEAGESVGYGGTWIAPQRSLLATLPIGYGDGWARVYGGASSALVRGRRVPLVGSVAMDAVMADVSAVPELTTDDEFVLLGAQGGERVTATELARARNTISWEVLASMAYRVARVYHAAAGLSGTRTLTGESLTR